MSKYDEEFKQRVVGAYLTGLTLGYFFTVNIYAVQGKVWYDRRNTKKLSKIDYNGEGEFMNSYGKKVVSFIMVAMMTISVQKVSNAVGVEMDLAPINPDMQTYVAENRINEIYGIRGNHLEDSHGKTDLIPESFTIQENQENKLKQPIADTYPEKYDLRSQNRVTSVKDQGEEGACWAFAAYGAMESYLKPEGEFDFSENNLRNRHGFDWEEGGNRQMSTAYMARGEGPVLEEDDPYPFGDSQLSYEVQKRLNSAVFIPNRSGPLENNNIKSAILEYGAVQTSMYSQDNFYGKNHSYYYNGYSEMGNHAVVIVGWDDNYSKSNFKTSPPGDGAFLVKNSWGKSWGENGYFYISYYDKFIGTDNAVYIAEDIKSAENIYQYDPLGMTAFSGYVQSDTAWFANVFKSGDSEESLNSVGLFAPSNNYEYEIFISADENLNTRKKVASGKFEFGGYYTVEFPGETIAKNSKFAVIVKGTGGDYPVPLEKPVPYASQASSELGQSFISYGGDSWQDVATSYPSSNVALKAFTESTKAEEEIVENFPEEPGQYDEWPEQLNVPTDKEWKIRFNLPIDWESMNGEKIYIKDSKGRILNDIALNPGTDEKMVLVKKLDGFPKGTYYLYIDKAKAQNGKELKLGIKMKFVVN